MNRIEELTLKYIDEPLPPAEEQELDALVAGDPESATLYKELLRLDAGLRGEHFKLDVAVETMNTLYNELATDTMKRISEASSGRVSSGNADRQSFWRTVRHVAIPIAAVIVLCVGLYFRQNWIASTGVVLETRGYTALQAGDSIPSARTIQTAAGSSLKFQYKDGSVVELGPDATMRVESSLMNSGKRIHLAQGKLACEIAPQRTPMVISTLHAKATVLGTAFTMAVSPATTMLQVTDGAVLLRQTGATEGVVVRAGFRATASAGTDIVLTPQEKVATPTTAAREARTSLFNGRDLTGWEITKGSWQVKDGVMMSHNQKGGSSRLESLKDYGKFELECRIRLDPNAWAEFQIQNYSRFFEIENAAPSVWHDLKVVVSGDECRATLDGMELPLKVGEASGSTGTGKLAFYVTAGKTVWVKDIYIREL